MSYSVRPELLINGAWRGGSTAISEPVLNPATEEVLAHVPYASVADLDDALEACQNGFEAWRGTLPFERQIILAKTADLLDERIETIARILTLEQGKPLTEARLELGAAVGVLRFLGEEGKRVYGRQVPSRLTNLKQVVLKEPVGPSLAFIAWNFPALNFMRKVSAALAAGCSIVIKPSEETPGTAVAIGHAFQNAGLPPGVLNIVFGVPTEVSEHLLASPIPRKLSFTGSVPIGKHLQKLASNSMKRCTMELGGHAPVIVAADADVETAAKMSVAGKFRNAGQVCVSPTRFIIEEPVYDAFVDAFVKHTRALVIGNGMDAGTQMGPLASERRRAAIEELVADAIAQGADLLSGGNRIGNTGHFYEPTVLGDVPLSARMMTEEPFGPVAPMIRVPNLDAAIEEANRLDVGLAGYAFTAGTASLARFSNELNVGMLGLNSLVIASPETPFGGVNESGYGSEGGIEGLEAFLRTKLVTEMV